MVTDEVPSGPGTVLGVIPARAGSRGIPGKNIRELNGKPLIAYSIEEGKKSGSIDRLIVSTDGEEIADIASGYGVDVLMRPAELSGDDAPMLPVLKHALEALEGQGFFYDVVACLQPTSPLRKARHVDNAIELFFERSCKTIVSVCPVSESPYWMVEIEDGRGRPFIKGGWEHASRQQLPELFRLNGAIFVYNRAIVEASTTLPDNVCVYEMSEPDSVDIDSELDWKVAEALMEVTSEQ